MCYVVDIHDETTCVSKTLPCSCSGRNGLMAAMMAWNRFSVLVILVIYVYAFVYSVTCVTTIIPWIGTTYHSFVNFVLFTLLTAVALYSYLLAVLIDPGAVPSEYVHDAEDVTAMYIQVKRKGGAARHCNKCQRSKPPRAHHCRVCNRCITRMDHHCPWLNTCVGHGNYKAFLLFLAYSEAALGYAAALHARQGWYILQGRRASQTLGWLLFDSSKEDARSFLWLSILQVGAATLTLPLLVGLGSLLGWHIYILSKNQTTIESHEGVSARAFDGGVGATFTNPYDLGVTKNWQQVLGSRRLLWVVPMPAAHGDGLNYPTALLPEHIQWVTDEEARQRQEEIHIG
eukprot:jgi/Ulvmu1/5889/UM026_0010.1